MRKREPSAKKPRGAGTRRKAPAASAAETESTGSSLTLDTALGFQVGDIITIGDLPGRYRVTGVLPHSRCVTYEPLEAPVSALRFWWPWVAGLAGIVALVVWAVVR